MQSNTIGSYTHQVADQQPERPPKRQKLSHNTPDTQISSTNPPNPQKTEGIFSYLFSTPSFDPVKTPIRHPEIVFNITKFFTNEDLSLFSRITKSLYNFFSLNQRLIDERDQNLVDLKLCRMTTTRLETEVIEAYRAISQKNQVNQCTLEKLYDHTEVQIHTPWIHTVEKEYDDTGIPIAERPIDIPLIVLAAEIHSMAPHIAAIRSILFKYNKEAELF